jgi:hypothetical protein
MIFKQTKEFTKNLQTARWSEAESTACRRNSLTNSGIAGYCKQLGGGSGVTAARKGNSGVPERQALTLAFLNRSARAMRFAERASIQFGCNSCQLGEKFGSKESPCVIHCRHLTDYNALG